MIAALIASAVVAYGIDTSGLSRHIAFGPAASAYGMSAARGEPFPGILRDVFADQVSLGVRLLFAP